MKRLVLLGLLTVFITSCGQLAARSEFWQHDTVYRTNEHLAFSWFGYRDVTPEDVQLSQQQNWWGIDVPYVPGQ
jgi:hypothetical protein